MSFFNFLEDNSISGSDRYAAFQEAYARLGLAIKMGHMTNAATYLGVSARTLRNWCRKYDIDIIPYGGRNYKMNGDSTRIKKVLSNRGGSWVAKLKNKIRDKIELEKELDDCSDFVKKVFEQVFEKPSSKNKKIMRLLLSEHFKNLEKHIFSLPDFKKYSLGEELSARNTYWDLAEAELKKMGISPNGVLYGQ